MPVENKKSTAITNADATPRLLNSSFIEDGILRESVGTVEVAAADDDNSVFRMVRVPSNARICSVELFNDAITGGTAYHVGAFRTAADGGAAIDNDVFATSVDLSSARVAPLDVVFEALNIDLIERRLWQILGLTSDPGYMVDIGLFAATIGTAAGTISLRVRWTL